MKRPKILVFASGSATGVAGSDFAKMVEATKGDDPILNADIVGVVSEDHFGDVARVAKSLHVTFSPWIDSDIGLPEGMTRYLSIVKGYRADYVVLLGWRGKVRGLDMATTINIHPGPLPLTCGLYGRRVHKQVMSAYGQAQLSKSAVTMHFVNDDDIGPIAFEGSVPIFLGDTPESLSARVNVCQNEWQGNVLNEIVHGRIRLEDGRVVGSIPLESLWS